MNIKRAKTIRRISLILISVIIIIIITTALYMRQARFGKAPEGKRLSELKKSPNFRNGKFQNINITPELTEGYNMLGVAYNAIFNKDPRRKPAAAIPSIRTDLLTLPRDTDVLVWFGHSSYFIQLDGLRFLVDPVLSGNASPIPGTLKSFSGTDIYTVDDMPEIDYLFITHDHYDHVDYSTLVGLKNKIKKVICGLGVGAHFEHWGFAPSDIIEKDWYSEVALGDGFTAFVQPARHFSGRGFTRNNTLWASYLLQSPTTKIYIGGDSGYDTHFAEIGKNYGPVDLAILDNGQYNTAWRYIHTHPHEVLQAAKDLKAKRLFPVHSSKFALANHPWDEPLSRITELNKSINMPLVTPIIGEPVLLKNPTQQFRQWWVGLK